MKAKYFLLIMFVISISLISLIHGCGQVSEPSKSISGVILKSISLSPASLEIEPSQSQSFVATGTFSDGSSNIINPIWSVEGAIGTITSLGVFTASSLGNGLIRATSGEVTTTANVVVTTEATIPRPSTPSGLIVSQSVYGLALSWEANSETNIVGYNIYRSASNYVKITSSPITATHYTDTDVSSSMTYSYKITAVNNSGLESDYSNSSSATTYLLIFVKKWGKDGLPDTPFSVMGGIFVKGSKLYVSWTHSGSERLDIFDLDSNILNYWHMSDHPVSSRYVATDSNGNIYFTSIATHKVTKRSSTCAYVIEWGGEGSADGHFSWPRGIVIDNSNNIFVVDGRNKRVQKFDTSGNFLSKYGIAGSGVGEFSDELLGIALDSSMNMYICDYGNAKILKFNSSGTFIKEWGSLGTGNGQFDRPEYIAIDNNDNAYVFENNNRRIQKFNSNGTYLGQYHNEGTGDGLFYWINGMNFNGDYLFLGIQGTELVQKFKK